MTLLAPKFKYFFTLTICYLFFLGMGNAQQAVEPVVKYLSGKDRFTDVEWDFYCSDGRKSGEWSKIKVPSNWELEGFGTYNYGHDHKHDEVKYGKEYGLYKHEFDVPQEWEGKKINIVFEGSMTDTEVHINGQLAGEIHQGAFYRFKYDISNLVNYGGENLLEVKVSKFSSNESVNEAERYADYWIFGGIFRPVYLEVLPELHFERVAINATADGNMDINAFLNKKSASNRIRVTLLDEYGALVDEPRSFGWTSRASHQTFQTTYRNIHAWNPEWPYLYTLQIDLLEQGQPVYTHKEKIGFRTVELVPHDGIYVNGEKIVMKGVARHSFHPHAGRCLSDQDHIEDVNLIKDMNMNAVRMSHYPPDKRFLDICDSMGLFVLDELGGWQKGYDTVVGPKLIQELILHHENHPSVIMWNFGNEGGWKFPSEKWFHEYDFQKRPIIYPWLRRNDTDTRHYPSWSTLKTRLTGDDQIFFPTELQHGLYDGGHGASMDDYWEAFKRSPQNAGGILWNLKDEAVWRTDLNNYDSDGNHGPDGILGPNNEKEGSFYTIKEIWSPVQINPFVISSRFNGKLHIRNEFIYTNLKDCGFSYRIIKHGNPHKSGEDVLASGHIASPDIAPGHTAAISIPLSDHFFDADVLEFKAVDPKDREIYTWRWPVKRAENYIPGLIRSLNYENHSIKTSVNQNILLIEVGEFHYQFDLSNGQLRRVKNEEGEISFTGGPSPVGYEGASNTLQEVTWEKRNDGSVVIKGSYEKYPEEFEWRVHKNGLLDLKASRLTHSKKDVQVLGLSFNYPESKIKSLRWMGDGPYRVYKNRLKGTTFNVWEKEYNNTITGYSFDSLVYPEFKGYHANLYWASFETEESTFRVYCKSPEIYLKMYNPPAPDDAGHAQAFYPEGDIAFLHYISGIGTKFQNTGELGPAAQPSHVTRRSEDVFKPMNLTFDFHANGETE
ncbi:hypothetical protein KUV50_14720 [Membranicola marinus]|uniref:beta-galactosidase n=1 Tax=Membranihabitans marinus TaxID=1227546 RepID=A0A953HZ72_9BACT|nr:glycoside hydrolase family 2 TIM barrel-domain containing protein [Membranihabitans marinus]MBY5959401.1 hypothetical protein [Membranihabitans marinus]